MTALVLSIALLQALPDANGMASVTTAIGRAMRRRGDRLVRVVPALKLQDGDRLETGDGGELTILSNRGALICLGPKSAVTIGDGADSMRLVLSRGEARVVSGGERPVSVVAAGATVSVRMAIARVAVRTNELRVWAESGTLAFQYRGERSGALSEKEELRWVGKSHTAIPAAGAGWSVHAGEAELASAAADSRWQKDLASRSSTTLLASQSRQQGAAPASARPTRQSSAAQRGRSFARPEIAAGGGARANGLAAAVANFAVSGLGGSASSAASGAASSDAVNTIATNTGTDVINLVTAQTTYTLSDVHLLPQDAFPQQREYWSIGIGTPPTHDVKDAARPGLAPIFDTGAVPNTIPIPGTDAYLVQIYPGGLPQSGRNTVIDPALGGYPTYHLDNLKGLPPQHPVISGATPLIDHSAAINNRLTFGLGEFAVQATAPGQPQLEVRRSDQDRSVTPDPHLFNSEREQPNPQVTLAFDPKTDKMIPVNFGPAPTYSGLDALQHAGATTLMAHELYGYAMRTGHTRFVIDGRILDITGYRGR